MNDVYAHLWPEVREKISMSGPCAQALTLLSLLKEQNFVTSGALCDGEKRKSVGLDPGGPVLNFVARGFMEGFKLKNVPTERGCRVCLSKWVKIPPTF